MVADDPHPNTASHPVLSWLYRHLRTLRPMSSTLTKRIVLTAAPRERPYELRDAQVRGLILRVQPSGHKAWIVTWAHGSVVPWGRSSICHLIKPAIKLGRLSLSTFSPGCPRLRRPSPPVAPSRRFSMITSSLGLWLSSRVVVSTRIASDPCSRGCCAGRSSKLTCPQWSDGGAGVSVVLMPSPRLLQRATLLACGLPCP